MFYKKIVLFLCFILFFINVQAKDVWRITSLNWEPYSGANITTQGNSIQILRELLKENNIRLVVEFYPWKRARKRARKKSYFGYFPAWPEEVRKGFFASPAIDWSNIAVMKRSEADIKYTNINNLFRNHKIGVIRTYVYPHMVNEVIEKYPKQIKYAQSELLLLKKLSKGRHSVAITDPDVMLYLAEKNGIDNVEMVKNILTKELVIAINNTKENRRRAFLLRKIIKKYMK